MLKRIFFLFVFIVLTSVSFSQQAYISASFGNMFETSNDSLFKNTPLTAGIQGDFVARVKKWVPFTFSLGSFFMPKNQNLVFPISVGVLIAKNKIKGHIYGGVDPFFRFKAKEPNKTLGLARHLAFEFDYRIAKQLYVFANFSFYFFPQWAFFHQPNFEKNYSWFNHLSGGFKYSLFEEKDLKRR